MVSTELVDESRLHEEVRVALPGIKAALVVRFCDNGMGVKEDDKPSIGQYGFTTKTGLGPRRQGCGSGIGVWFCSTIMPIFGVAFSLRNRCDGLKGCDVEFVFWIE